MLSLVSLHIMHIADRDIMHIACLCNSKNTLWKYEKLHHEKTLKTQIPKTVFFANVQNAVFIVQYHLRIFRETFVEICKIFPHKVKRKTLKYIP